MRGGRGPPSHAALCKQCKKGLPAVFRTKRSEPASDSPDWWKGRNERTGKVGYFPANHVSPKDVAAVRAVAAEGPAAAAEGPAGVEDAPLVGAAAAVEEIAATVSAAPMFDVPAEEAPADAAGGAVAEGAPVLVAAPSAVEM